MTVYLDTNILLDIVEQRMPFYVSSQAVLDQCDRLGFELKVGWHGLATLFYITAKKRDEAYANQMIRALLGWATVATVGHGDAMRALNYGIADYEDALQAAAATACAASWLVTRDAKGFAGSPVPAIEPNAFLTRFGSPSSSTP
ncbi:MAG TPA: PIN domain-containing protein [Candidatus Saccharimonadia bacterium]|nr:PIN domain-containing protein [Candidatus Saccharimonadia bacterium]